eukprot:140866_1
MSQICQISKGAATKIFAALENQILIQSDWHEEMPLPKLKLKTINYTKMYKNEKILEDCTVEDIIKLLSHENADITNSDAKDQGVFAVVIAKQKGKRCTLESIPNWKNKIINFFRENNIDGKKVNEIKQKQLCQNILDALSQTTAQSGSTHRSKQPHSIFRAGINLVLRTLKNRYVNGILSFQTHVHMTNVENQSTKERIIYRNKKTRYVQTCVDRIYLESARDENNDKMTARQLAIFLHEEEYDTDCIQYELDSYYDDIHKLRMKHKESQNIQEAKKNIKCNISQHVPNINFNTIEHLREFMSESPTTFIDELLLFCANKSKYYDDTVVHKLKMLIEKDEYDTDAIKEELKSKATKSSFLMAVNNSVTYKKSIEQFADHYRILSKHFSTGIVFWYWEWYKYNICQQKSVYDQRWISGKIDFGPSRYDLYVNSKYESIKQEALNCGINTSDFASNVIDKANEYMHTNRCKKMQNMYPNYNFDPLHYGIKYEAPIQKEHLYAVILYCNFSDFCTSFRSSFRKAKWNESIRSVKSRNSAYFYTSKYLRELVQYYGCNNDVVRNTGPFWCGMSLVMNLSSFSVHINAPLSSTVDRAVGLRFSGDDGMLIQINNINYPGKYERYFNCSWISVYPEEAERIWAGGVYPVEVQSITLCTTQSSYKSCVSALYKLDAILSGQKVEWLSNTDFKWLQNCVDSYFGIWCNIDRYAEETFYLFCHRKTHIILDLFKIEECLINNSKSKSKPGKFIDLFMHSIQGQSMVGVTIKTIKSMMKLASKKNNNKQNLFRSTMFKLFPNLQEIVIRITGGYMDTPKMYPFSIVSLESLLSDDNVPKSLKNIIIKDRFESELLQKFDIDSEFQVQLKNINKEKWLCISL